MNNTIHTASDDSCGGGLGTRLRTYLCHKLVSDVWVVESPPEFKGHPTTPTCTHQLPLQWTRLRQGEGVVCLGVKGRVRHTQCRASAVRMKKCLKTCGELE